MRLKAKKDDDENSIIISFKNKVWLKHLNFKAKGF